MKKIITACAALATGVVGVGLAFALMPSAASEPQAPTPVTLAAPASAKTPAASPPALSSLPSLPAAGVTAGLFEQQQQQPSQNGKTTEIAPKDEAAPVAATPAKRLDSYTSVNVDGPYVALTFDDGPNPETTPKLLKILADRNIKATFFMIGENAKAAPDIVKAVAAAGHEVENHSWNHPQLSKLSQAAADKQVEDTSNLLEQLTGVRPIYLRPPYGAMTPALKAHLHEKYGLSLIFWSVDPLDWKNRNSQAVYDQIMRQVHPGAIILSHDIHPTTVAAMPRVIDDLIAKGYKIVTVSELIAHARPSAPKVAVATDHPVKKKAKPKTEAKSKASSKSAPAGSNPGAQPVSTGNTH